MLISGKGSLFAVLVLAFVALTGCGGPQRGEVTGQVTLDGQPIDGGEIRFLPNVGLPARADIVKGRYTIPATTGPSVGEVRVEVRWVRRTGKQVPAMAPAPPGTMIDETAEAVPERFNRNSELTTEIQPGKNAADFALSAQ